MDNMNPMGAPASDNVTPPVAPTPAPTPSNSGGSESDTKAKALGLIAQFEAWLQMYMVTKAPFQIPMGGKEFLATIAPYLIIIGVVLFVISLPVLMGFSAMMGGAVTSYVGWGIPMIIGLLGGVIATGLEAWAVPGLFKRTQASWRLVFYATLVSFAVNVFSLNLLGAVIGGIIGWYLLFQVKELYKN